MFNSIDVRTCNWHGGCFNAACAGVNHDDVRLLPTELAVLLEMQAGLW